VKYHVIRPWESRLFRQCRRAWDFSARERQDYELAEPLRVVDFDEAIHEAMDVYYFPGMWDWNRAIVRPVAVQGFVKSMRKQRAAYAERRELTPEQEQQWAQQLELGTEMLQRYFSWALHADRFTSVQVATLFDVTIPNPDRPQDGLLTPDGRGIWFRVRLDTVIVDEHENSWLVEHRLVDEWGELDELVLDEQSLTRAWAWELAFLGKMSGTIINELRMPPAGVELGPADAMDVRALQGPSGLIKQEYNDHVRRTQIPRGSAELADRGLAVAYEVREMTDPGLSLYPNPSPDKCGSCHYRRPCQAMSAGGDPAVILESAYRKRTVEDFEPGKLGSIWGYMPETPRTADYRSPARGDGDEAAAG